MERRGVVRITAPAVLLVASVAGVWSSQASGSLVCQASDNPDVQKVTVLGTVHNDCD